MSRCTENLLISDRQVYHGDELQAQPDQDAGKKAGGVAGR